MIRAKLKKIARAKTDGGAVHALLNWLDTLPPELLIAAEGRRRAGIGGGISDCLPRMKRPTSDPHSTVEVQVESDRLLARVYWEFPNMIYSGIPGEAGDES